MGRNEYVNKKKKELYDQILLQVPKGTKDKLKEVSSNIGISVNEYINRLIKADIEKDHKQDNMTDMLLKWGVQRKYHPMIQSASFLPTAGYYIKLKKSYVNDKDGTDEILCSTSKELRHIMQFTHPVRTEEELQGFDSKTYEQLLKWQVPKCRFKDIAYVGDHHIVFKNGDVWKFKSVNELRYMWKQSREC